MIILLLLTLLTYLAGLFVDVTRDASKYATIAREIYDSGDFIHLRAEGEPYIQKPPLLFWLSALSFRIFGLSNFAFKLPLLLFSFAGLYSTYRLGRSLYGTHTGILAALLLGTSQISFLYNMDIHTDTLMQSLVAFALWQLYDFMAAGRNLNFILGFCGIGLAMLSKGPMGAVVPAFAVVGYLVFTRQYAKLADVRWYLGILISLVCIIPALAGLYTQSGYEGIRFFFWTNNAGRLAGEYTAADRSVLFYLYNLFILFFPWGLWLFTSLYFDFRALFQRKLHSPDWFVFSGLWFFFLIISFSRGKLPNYIYVLMPLFSLVTARYLVPALSGHQQNLYRLFLKMQTIMALLSLVILSGLVFWLFPLTHVWQWGLFSVMLAVAFFTFFYKSPPVVKLLFPTLSLVILFNFFINQHAAPSIFSDQASVKAAALFNKKSLPGDRLYNYNYYSHELYFYSRSGARKIMNDVTLFELMKKPGNWVLTTEEVVNRMPQGEFPVPEKFPLTHVWINKLSFKYLNPTTRNSSYDTLYLLRSTAGDGL